MEKSLFQQLKSKMDATLTRSADVELNEKEGGSVSFGDMLGNLDAGGCLILAISVGVILSFAIIISTYFSYYVSPSIVVYLIAGIPSVLAGLLTWVLLFRLKRWLKK
jgi:hypothetical protein